MDIEKARTAYRLYARRDDLKASIMTMGVRMEKGIGTTTITVPTSWLPEIIRIAEAEMSDIDEQINKL